MFATDPSPVGSEIFAVFALLVIGLGVLLLLRRYLPLRTTPAYLLVPIFFALGLPASIILLVPIDLASSARNQDAGGSRGIWLPERALLVGWRISYWLTFALTCMFLSVCFPVPSLLSNFRVHPPDFGRIRRRRIQRPERTAPLLFARQRSVPSAGAGSRYNRDDIRLHQLSSFA